MNALVKNSSKPAINDVFESFFDNNFWLDRNLNNNYSNEPANYYYDNENKEHNIIVQAPGFKKEDIEIEVDNKGISLKGELHSEAKNKIGKKTFHYVMKKNGIDSKTINAKLEDGLLEIKFKTEKEKSAKKIEIK